MIVPLCLILFFQLAGEIVSRAFGLPLPGPVLAMCLLVTACAAWPRIAALLRPMAHGILSNLSLFFVPAGVGIVGHLSVLRTNGIGLGVAIAGSTILAMAVGAWVFQIVARWTGSDDPSAMKPKDGDNAKK